MSIYNYRPFNFFNETEKPNIILCKPNLEKVGDLNVTSLDINWKANDVSEISFSLSKESNLQNYDLVKGKKRLGLAYAGVIIAYFIIETNSIEEDLSKSTKSISAYSLEYELASKKMPWIEGTHRLTGSRLPAPPGGYGDDIWWGQPLSTMLTMLCPDWNFTFHHSFNEGSPRYFQVDDVSILDFIYKDIQEAFQCLPIVDSLSKTINFAPITAIGTDTSIYLGYDNLIKKVKTQELSNEVVTSMKVLGGNDLNIRMVNPTGSDTLYNFNYFKNEEFMSADLITALDNFQTLYAAAIATYESYKVTLQSLLETEGTAYEAYLLASETVKTSNLVLSESVLSTSADYTNYDSETGKYSSAELSSFQQLYQTALANEQTTKITWQNAAQAVTNKQNEMIVISESLSLENNFTLNQRKELSALTIEYTYQNDAYIVTDNMSVEEQYQQANELYTDAVQIFSRLSAPSFEFEIDVENFLQMVDYAKFIEQFGLLNTFWVEIRKDYAIQVRLIGFTENIENNGLVLKFSTKYRTSDAKFLLEDLLNSGVKAGSTISFNRSKYGDWINNRGEVMEYISNTLDLSKQALTNTVNQDQLFDETGLKLRESIAPGVFKPEQIWMTNNQITMSDDSFGSLKMVLGKIPKIDGEPGDKVFGLVADTIVGRLLAGANLLIENENSTFRVDGEGATLTDGVFSVTTEDGKGKVLINPTQGILIQGKNGSVMEDRIYLDLNTGRIKAQGLDILGDSTFEGTLTANVINAIKAQIDIVVSNTVIVNNLYAEYGRIANLSVSELDTSWQKITNYLMKDTNLQASLADVNYQRMYEDRHEVWTSSVAPSDEVVDLEASVVSSSQINITWDDPSSGTTVQYTNKEGQKLYWVDNTLLQGGMTTNVTAYPVMVYTYKNLLKRVDSVELVNDLYTPVSLYGAGSGVGDNGKAKIYKDQEGFHIIYYHSVTGEPLEIKWTDNGIIGAGGNNLANINLIDHDITSTDLLGKNTLHVKYDKNNVLIDGPASFLYALSSIQGIEITKAAPVLLSATIENL